MAKKVLIIEDEKALREMLETKLKSEGFEVQTAEDGELGYNKIEDFKPDLILLDIIMPKMDGYEVMEKMNNTGIKIPVIIISNSGQPVEIEKTTKLGAVSHLIKTEFDPNDVANEVKKAFAKESNPKGSTEATITPKEDANAKKLGVKVLLVEDDSFLRDICSKKLVREGYTVYEAIDGEQALENIKKIKPDIILLDIILPAIDGFQILNAVRTSSKKEIAKTPVIMLSNLGQEDDIKKAKELGANDYMVKAHFTVEEIVKKIKSVLGK